MFTGTRGACPAAVSCGGACGAWSPGPHPRGGKQGAGGGRGALMMSLGPCLPEPRLLGPCLLEPCVLALPPGQLHVQHDPERFRGKTPEGSCSPRSCTM